MTPDHLSRSVNFVRGPYPLPKSCLGSALQVPETRSALLEETSIDRKLRQPARCYDEDVYDSQLSGLFKVLIVRMD